MDVQKNNKSGFTIVELVISMIVIGILATIMFISYGGIIKKVATENLKSDLLNASNKLAKFKATYGVYPVTISCSIPDSKNNLCIKGTTSDTTFTYNVNTAVSPDKFGLTAAKGNDADLSYRTADGSEPIACPSGYIVVPGSKTYGTSNFCVMKYEAKHGSSDIPVSTALSYPWVGLVWNDAVAFSERSCSGCHLVSEAEWMTIAQNLIKIPSNWSGGVVGNGYMFRGHSDGDPNAALESSADDLSYYNTNQSSGDQRRTMTLSNGEVIWDLAGNVNERTSGLIVGSQPGITGESSFGFKEWANVNNGIIPQVNPYPANAFSAAASWTAHDQGIGGLYSNAGASVSGTRSVYRGGRWDINVLTSDGGIFFLNADGTRSSGGSDSIGFRVTR